MDVPAEIKAFLTAHRGRLSPGEAGLPVVARNRRVTGLRREEVASLAGISVEYYTRLERGLVGGVSDEVLDAVARALRLDSVEADHLRNLVRAAGRPRAAARARTSTRVSPSVQWLVDAVPTVPAYVRNGRLDIIAANQLGRALYSPVFDTDGTPNPARFAFLDPRAREFWGENWEVMAHAAADSLRAEAGRSPYDGALQQLIGELSTRSDDFRRMWADQGVHRHRSGVKTFHHPVVGALTLHYQVMDLVAEPGLTMLAYTAEPGSPDQRTLDLLISWALTPDDVDATPA